MKTVRVTTNGRVTIPAELRKKHGFYPGRNAEDGIRIIPLAAVEEIRTFPGSLGLKGKMLKSLMREKKRESK